MDKLTAMRTFVRVVETGSFSAVADERAATQSSVSKQVAALEAELGVKLLLRTTRSISLTEEGEVYFEQARRLLSEVEEAEVSIRTGEKTLRGWLRIAASAGFGRLKLMPLIRGFLSVHPEVRIDIQLYDGFVDLVEQGIDIAVRIGNLSDSTLTARRIGTTHRALLAHRDYIRSLPSGLVAPSKPEDLLQHNCIVYTGLATKNAWTFTAGPGAFVEPGTTRTVRVFGRIQSNSSEVIRSSVIQGLGIGYSPTWLFDDELASGELVRLLPDWVPPSLPINLVCPAERRHSAKVRAFGDYVVSQWNVGSNRLPTD